MLDQPYVDCDQSELRWLRARRASELSIRSIRQRVSGYWKNVQRESRPVLCCSHRSRRWETSALPGRKLSSRKKPQVFALKTLMATMLRQPVPCEFCVAAAAGMSRGSRHGTVRDNGHHESKYFVSERSRMSKRRPGSPTTHGFHCKVQRLVGCRRRVGL